MRVTFDSNVWEKVYDRRDTQCAVIRDALTAGKIEGFICEAGFRIEAIQKKQRAAYFAQPHLGFRFGGIVEREGRSYYHMSVGPEDDRHPGLPAVQAARLQEALKSGFRLMRALAWMGLPAPQELRDPTMFVPETLKSANQRQQRQIEASARIDARGVGKAAFDALGGWNLPMTAPNDEKKFHKACAEWADGELVSAHIAYQHDTLCTDDRAKTAKVSILNPANRAWLTAHYGVVFKTIDELTAEIAQ
jgi:hypothetical protein